MGLPKRRRLQLASVDVAVPHGGLPDVWVKALGPSFDQRAVPCRQYSSGFSGAPGADRRVVAELHSRSALWPASAARGIGGVGGRAQGRFERVLLAVDYVGVRKIRRRVRCSAFDVGCWMFGLLRAGAVVFCVGIDEQADGGDLAMCVAAAGLLAAQTTKCGMRNAEWGTPKFGMRSAECG